MGRNSVAILDVRSSELTVAVGERGVNNTFVFTAMKTEPYLGFDERGKFYDPEGLADAARSAVCAAEKICNERLKKLYIGVPGGFSTVLRKEHFTGFPKKIRIGQKEIDDFFASGLEEIDGYRCIHTSSMIYFTADNRNVVDPVGLHSNSLRGVLSYFYAEDSFVRTFDEIFRDMKLELRFLPSTLASATYLIPAETRDEYALFLDTGYLSTTIAVLLGGGVLAQRTFWAGSGKIVGLIMERTGLPVDAAAELLDRANLYIKGGQRTEFTYGGESYEIDASLLVETVKEGLDILCEQISAFLDECDGRELDFKPLYVTGEGITGIRGALEHISKRISRVTELVKPDLPYYNKPSMSSRIALTDMAYEDNRKGGVLRRIINRFGG